MATKARHFLKFFLAGLMALIGFSSCSDDVLKAAYGSPNAHLKVNAKVVDEDGKPIKGARLNIRYNASPWSLSSYVYYIVEQGGIAKNQIETNSEGLIPNGVADVFDKPDKDNTFIVFRSSLNPEIGGKYESDSVKVVPVMLKEGDGGWNKGTYKLEGKRRILNNCFKKGIFINLRQ